MNCPLCGEVSGEACRCQSEPTPAALPRWRPDAGDCSASSSSCAAGQEMTAEAQLVDTESHEPEASPAEGPAPSDADASAWRDELSARLNRYRARRKVRPPRYPSLSLQFDAVQTSAIANEHTAAPTQVFETASNQALALDGMTEVQSPAPVAIPAAAPPAASHLGAKIIEFPRFAWGAPAWGPPPPPPDQLAEPVSDRPRILEVPEVAPPAPALGGITIDAALRPEEEKRPGTDIPLQSAPLALRLMATMVDGLIVAIASALFAFIFWKVAAVRPPLIQILGLAVGMTFLFWAIYQYLLIVYAAGTPGLLLARLELARFDGTRPSRRLRRWRVLASYLSAASLGMGYAWLFLDEDALCWHDRITHTYLAPGKQKLPA